MRITLDTNVLISSHLDPGGSADQVMQLVKERKVELILSRFILNELARILTEKFDLPAQAVQRAVARVERLATIVDPQAAIDIIKAKADDNRILECAVSGQVDYLITGDKKHILPLGSIEGIPIITITEFHKRYQTGP
jgi:putative PIN family toxin of toxin-antitoxin system